MLRLLFSACFFLSVATVNAQFDNHYISWLSGKTPETSVPATCPESVWYTEQSQIDSFPVLYPDCHVIEGNLILQQHSGNGMPTIHNLAGFRNIHTVHGGLFIRRNSLIDLHGFDSLRTIGGNLEITGSLALQSLKGLENLTAVGGEIVIGNNQPLIKNMRGLDNLERCGDDFKLFQQGIESLEGLDNLNFVGGFFDIHSDALLNLHGLENLDTVKNTLTLSGLQRLKSLSGLQNLRYAGLNINTDSLVNLQGLDNWHAGKELYINGNKQLESLDGIENLQQLDGYGFPPVPFKYPALWIAGNTKLHDLSALDHPVSLADGLYIFQNPHLSECAVRAICDYLPTPPDTISIFGNLQDCNSAAEILTKCSSSGTTGLSEKIDFQVFPNPLPVGKPLQVILENDIYGMVNVEIFGIDGRLKQAVTMEKTERRLHGELKVLGDVGGWFLVRVSKASDPSFSRRSWCFHRVQTAE